MLLFDWKRMSLSTLRQLRHILVVKVESDPMTKSLSIMEEKVIRQQLSPREDATTRSKSFFLKQNVHLTRIDRGVAAGGSTVPLTCVCVSQRCIPQNTLDILMDTKGIMC